MTLTVTTMRSLWERLPEAARIACVVALCVLMFPAGIGLIVWWWAWMIALMGMLPWPELPGA